MKSTISAFGLMLSFIVVPMTVGRLMHQVALNNSAYAECVNKDVYGEGCQLP